MIVYTFLSHACGMLGIQLAAIRAYVAGVAEIVVVQGPFGARPDTSGGDVRLGDTEARRLGVRTIEAPGDALGLASTGRYHEILAWVGAGDWAARDAGVALFLHGDLMPAAPMDAQSLLGGCAGAGRRFERGAQWRLPHTWLATRIKRFKAETLTPAGMWNGEAFGGFGSRPATGADAPGTVGVEEMHWEWCEPGFLHCDKLAMAGWPGELHARKVEQLQGWAAAKGLKPAQVQGEKLVGLVAHPTRIFRAVDPVLEARKAAWERGRARMHAHAAEATASVPAGAMRVDRSTLVLAGAAAQAAAADCGTCGGPPTLVRAAGE